MKKNFGLGLAHLADRLNQLETSLFHYRFTGYDHWLINRLESNELSGFVRGLFFLAKECLYMQQRINASGDIEFCSCDFIVLSKTEVIELTRELIFCCDLTQLSEYRRVTAAEYQQVRYLEIIHAELIGDVYFSHPGLVSSSPGV